MKHPLPLALGALLASAGPAHADCANPFASPDEILTFHLRLTRAGWDTLRLAPAVGSGCAAEFPRVQAEFRCGETGDWMTIGAHRKRGDQRGRDTDQKPPLKLDFNHVISGQSWPVGMGDRGYRKLSLNQGQHDEPGGILPDLLSEYIALRMLKREVPIASNVAYARLHVTFAGETKPPEYHGLYILIEDIDRAAIRRRFGDASGAVYKTTTGDCRHQEVFNDAGENAARAAFTAWSAKAPASLAGKWMAETAKAMDLESLLRAEAIRDILYNYNDTLLGSHYSNFVFFDPATAAPRTYFPWDCDDCFKGPVSVGTTNISTSAPLIPSSSDLGTKTRNHAEIRPRYYEMICQMINGTLAPDRVVAEIDQVHAAIKGIVAEEAGPVWGGKNPLDEATPWTYGWEYKRLRTWYPARIANIRQQLQQRGAACPPRADGAPTDAGAPDARSTDAAISDAAAPDGRGAAGGGPSPSPTGGTSGGDAGPAPRRATSGGCVVGGQVDVPGAPLLVLALVLFLRRRAR